MSNICEHCGAQLTQPDTPICLTCGRPLTEPNGTKEQSKRLPKLVVREPGQAVKVNTITLSKPLITIGRTSINDLVIEHPAVSRRHARLERRNNHYWLIDLDSTNGTSINGLRIKSQVLNDGDVIHIVDQQNNAIEITFHTGITPESPTQIKNLGDLDLQDLPTITLGRDPGNQIYLDHPLVSRRHAQVEMTPRGYLIRDLNSSNGTFVNGQPIYGPQPLHIDDTVQIGPFKLVYGERGFSQYTSAGDYRLDAVGLTHEVLLPAVKGLSDHHRRKRILDNIDLSIQPNEFIALVGGSGAGKSSLMNALSGFVPAKKGRVFLNGDDLYANFAAYRTVLGYVPQDDVIHRQLPVRSALTYAAQLRLPDASPAEIERRINDVLQEVEMLGHDSKPVKWLSGGQRKRVSIAVELLADPGLFFLDEPTSGLDPGLEKKMMRMMRRMADSGRTIVLSTHATASLALCSHLAFMADGHLAYFGPPEQAFTFFGAKNFTEIYHRLSQPIDPLNNPLPSPCQVLVQQATQAGSKATVSAGEAWAKCFQASRLYQVYVANRIQTDKGKSHLHPSSPQPIPRLASGLWQFRVLSQRYFDLISRDAISLFVLLAVMPIIAFLLWFTADQYDLIGKDADTIETEIQAEIEKQRSTFREHQSSNADQDTSDEVQFQASYLVTDQAQKLLFIMALAATLLGIFAASYEIIKEEAIYRRERMVNLKILPYLTSKVVVLGLFAIVQCFLFLLVVRLRVRYPVQGIILPAALEMYVTLFLATLANICLGLLISARVRSSGIVVYVILIVLFFQIIFAEAIFKLPTLARPLSYLTTTRWTLEALGSTVDLEKLSDQEVVCIEFEDFWKRTALKLYEDADPPCQDGQVRQKIDLEFDVTYHHSTSHLLLRWSVLAEFALIFGGLAYVAQKAKDQI